MPRKVNVVKLLARLTKKPVEPQPQVPVFSATPKQDSRIQGWVERKPYRRMPK